MTVRANQRPSVSISTSPQSVDGGGTVSLSAIASDPEGDSLSYSWSGSGSFANSSSRNTTWTAPDGQSTSQTYTLTLTVSDGHLSQSDTVDMTVFADVPANTAPTVTIDILSQTVNGGETVNLAATGDDLEDDVLTYSWSGSGSFKDSSDPNTEWTAPAAQSTAQTYKLTLSVSDGDLSGSDFVNITVRANQCPSVTIDTSSRTVNGRSYVSLEATTSDPEGDSLSYTWSGSGTFSSPSSEDSVWRAPAAQTTEQTYALKLSVSDGRLTCSDSVDIIVRANQPPSVTITAPTAPIQPVNGGDTVSLKAIASDPEGDSLSYLWSATGNAGSFDNASSRNTDWTAPDAQPTNQAYTLTLTVSDTRLSKTATVDITVLGVVEPANTAPEVTILTPSQTVDVGETIDLAATGDDLEDDVLTYLWSASGNIGSFGDPSDPNTSWTAPQTVQSTLSTYTVELELTATDQGDLTDTHSITITINRPPTVTVSASSQDINVGDIVTLQATASDPDGNSLSYSWSTSPSSSGSFDDSAEKDTSWKGPETVQSTLSTYEVTLTLTVSDSRLTGSDSVTITINRPPTVTITAPTAPVQPVNGGDTVTLQATASDPDGDALEYSWSATDDAGSFGNATALNTTWTAPDAHTTDQTYTITLAVEDPDDLDAEDTVEITVTGTGELSVEITAPTKENIEVAGGAVVTLEATASGPPSTPLWTATDNAGSFADSDALNTTWTAPDAQATDQTYALTITATAGSVSKSDSVNVTVTGTPPPPVPSVEISADETSVTEGDSIEFTVTASPAPSSDLTVTVGVTENGMFISGTTPTEATIEAGKTEGIFTVQTENDEIDEPDGTVTASIKQGTGYDEGMTTSVDVTVEDDDPPPSANHDPTVSIETLSQDVHGGQRITLLAEAEDLDNDHLSYEWTATGGSFEDDEVLNATWTAPEAQSTDQTYTLTIAVDDGQGGDPVEVSVTMTVLALSLPAPDAQNLFLGRDASFPLPAASGGNPPYQYSVDATTLPNDLMFDQTTRIVSGEPTATGEWEVTYSVEDSSSPAVTVEHMFTITVESPMSIEVTGASVTLTHTPPVLEGFEQPHTFALYRRNDDGITFPNTPAYSSLPTTPGPGANSYTFENVENGWYKGCGGRLLEVYERDCSEEIEVDVLRLPDVDDLTGTVGVPFTLSNMFPLAIGRDGSEVYEIDGLPDDLDFQFQYIVGTHRPLPVGTTEVTYPLIYKVTQESSGDIDSVTFSLTIYGVDEASALDPELRIRLVDGNEMPSGDVYDRLLDSESFWLVFSNYAVVVIDHTNPELSYEPYEFRINVPENTGVDAVTHDDSPCEYPSPPGDSHSDWRLAHQYHYLQRCRLGDGLSNITVDARIRGTDDDFQHDIAVTLVRAPHHADNIATYRMCGDAPDDANINFANEINSSAQAWNLSDSGISFSESATAECNESSNVTRIRHVTSEVMGAICPSRSGRAYGCVTPDLPLDDNEHYLGLRFLYVYPIYAGQTWTVATDRLDENHINVQAVMTHEFGHVAGLGHSKIDTALMNDGYDHAVLYITDHDQDGMLAIYEDHPTH